MPWGRSQMSSILLFTFFKMSVRFDCEKKCMYWIRSAKKEDKIETEKFLTGALRSNLCTTKLSVLNI